MSKSKKVSTTEYAKLVGVSRQIVARHIKKGHLKKSVSRKGRNYLLDVKKANKEWELIKSQHAPKEAAIVIDAKEETGLVFTECEEGEEVEKPVNCGQFGLLPTIKQSRTADEYYKASLKKLEYLEKDGELVNADVVANTWIEYINNAKSRFLTIPQKAAQQIVDLEDVNEIEKILTTFLKEALEELSREES